MSLFDLLQRNSRWGLIANIRAAIGVATAANLFVVIVPSAPERPGEIPGALVGSVWIVLFALMGAARWSLARKADQSSRWVTLLISFCAAYPLYTIGLQSQILGFSGQPGHDWCGARDGVSLTNAVFRSRGARRTGGRLGVAGHAPDALAVLAGRPPGPKADTI